MKCQYCGRTCDGRFCCDECGSKAQSYQERVEKVNVAVLIFSFLAVMTVFTVVAIVFDPPLGLGIMLIGIGSVFVPYPYVNTDTLAIMCIRTSIVLMRLISAACIVTGCIMLCLYIW